MDTVHLIHFDPLDFVVFVPYLNHRKYCELIQKHFCLEYLYIQDEHEYMVVGGHLVVLLMPIQQMHNTFQK